MRDQYKEVIVNVTSVRRVILRKYRVDIYREGRNSFRNISQLIPSFVYCRLPLNTILYFIFLNLISSVSSSTRCLHQLFS